MTTPDLEALARELEERACALDKDARDWRKHNPPVGSFSDLRAGDREASAIAHRQAAALIRAKAPGRRDIARLIWPVAFGKRTDGLTLDQVSDMQIDALTKADAILALFHTPAEAGGGEDEGTVRTAGTKLLTALERYGFPVSDVASTAAMSVEARDLHNAARRFKIAITSTRRAADEPAVTNGQ